MENEDKDNVEYLPLWKKNATAEETLLELAMVARKHPERFEKWVLIYCEDVSKDLFVRAQYNTIGTMEYVGVLQLGLAKAAKQT